MGLRMGIGRLVDGKSHTIIFPKDWPPTVLTHAHIPKPLYFFIQIKKKNY